MTNTIAEKLVDTLDGIVDIGLDEEGTPGRPYAVYTLDVAPVYTKDGIYKLAGTLEIRIYGKAFGEVDAMTDLVRSAVASRMRCEEYRTHLNSDQSDETDDMYRHTLEYAVAQYNVPAQPDEEDENNN